MDAVYRLVASCVVAALAVGWLYRRPWRRLLGEELPAPWLVLLFGAVVVGVFAAWCWAEGMEAAVPVARVWRQLLVIAASAAVGLLVEYVTDELVGRWLELRVLRQRGRDEGAEGAGPTGGGD